MNYNPADLTINGIQVDGALSTASPGHWVVTSNNDATDGILYVTLSSNGPALPAGALNLVDVLASVPSGATYGAAALLKLTNLRVNEGQLAAAGDEAVQKVALLGDTSGNQTLGGQDASDISAVVVNRVSGFSAYADTDPIIIGDATGDGTLSGLDASYVAQASVYLPVPQIPSLGTTSVLPNGNIDPTVTIGSVTGNRGSTVDVPLTIDQGTGLLSSDFTINFDTSRLSLTDGDVSLGSLLSSDNWGYEANVIGGTLHFTEYGSIPLPSGSNSNNVDLVDLNFQVLNTAPAGTAAVSFASVARTTSTMALFS